MATVGIESAFGLLAVFTLMSVFFYVLDKYKKKYLHRDSEDFSLESQISIGNRQRLIMIKAKNKKILIASSHDSVTVIDTWNE